MKTFHEPVLRWANPLVRKDRAVIIGINGPQGCGKSTLCEAIVKHSADFGLRSVTLSIDDFYLTRQEQVKLAAAHPDDPTLQQRGYPGTHDIELGAKTLKALQELKKTGSVLCPQYDKSAHQGQGDRFPKEKWKSVDSPLDLIFFEGWMLGFPVENYRPWHSLLEGFIFLDPKEIEYVIDWRVSAEEARKAEGKPGMSKEEITAYVKKFIPAYEKYLPLVRSSLPEWRHSLKFLIGKDRQPLIKS